MKSAKNFGESDELRTTMQKAGVKGKPQVYYLEEIENTLNPVIQKQIF